MHQFEHRLVKVEGTRSAVEQEAVRQWIDSFREEFPYFYLDVRGDWPTPAVVCIRANLRVIWDFSDIPFFSKLI